jgi:hypothetical protein
MTSLLLFHPTFEKTVVGCSRLELVQGAGVLIDTKARCAIIYGEQDTVTIGGDFSDEELCDVIAERALSALVRNYGWFLYRRDDRA